MKDAIERELPDYLTSHELLNVLPNPRLKVYEFANGEELKPLTEYILPKLQTLWSSALERRPTDPLVLHDSETYPFRKNDRVMLIQNSKSTNLAAIFLYRELNSDSPTKGLYLNICLVNRDYQGQGLTRALLRKAIEEINPNYIALHTQNEAMVQTLRPFCPNGSLFPIDGVLPKELEDLTKPHIKDAERFNPVTLIEKGMYNGEPLYGNHKEIHTSHADIRDFFQRNVDFQNGDSVLVIGLIEKYR